MGLRKPSFGRKRSSANTKTTSTPSKPSQIQLTPERSTTEKNRQQQHEIIHAPQSSQDTDRESDISDPVDDSAYCTRSRCGCPDAIHETLLFVGKKMYDCFGDPPNAEAKDYVVGVSEIGEEGATLDDATFCCWNRDQVLEDEMPRKKKMLM